MKKSYEEKKKNKKNIKIIIKGLQFFDYHTQFNDSYAQLFFLSRPICA